MFLFKNAWKSVVRAPGRNILIGIIVFMIATASCIALSIRNSADEVVQSYTNSSDITGTIGVDREAMRQQRQSAGDSNGVRNMEITFTQPTYEEIVEYGESDYLEGFYYSLSASLNSASIEPVSNSTDDTTSGSSSEQYNPGIMPGADMMRNQADFTVLGYSSNEAMTQFMSGDYTIAEGEMFADEETGNVCVISDELADYNDLVLGSVITLVNPNDETHTVDLTVVGIYQDNTTDDTSFNWFSNAANQILTNFTALNTFVESSQNLDSEDAALTGRLSSTFLIQDAASVDAFEAELRDKGLDENLTLTTNLESVQNQLQPIKNLSSFALIFLIIVLIVGGVILLVLNMINIRERKYEVGVLRAIGMKKHKVAFQFITELFLVTAAAVILGTGIGAVASVPTANSMLAGEISNQTSSAAQQQMNFGRGGQGGTMPAGGFGGMGGQGGFFGITENATYVDQINAVINPMVVLELAGISILLTLISGTISVIFISRYEPLKILSNR